MNDCCDYECTRTADNCPARAVVAPIKSSTPRFHTADGGRSVDHGMAVSMKCEEPRDLSIALEIVVGLAVGAVVLSLGLWML